ncbi:MAG: hypothetical protein MK101_08450 [Phycisphaerales bacterium]|nr:hypothetical protein [Phycisphaerales bacterium]
MTTARTLTSTACLLITSSLTAQWSDDPALNTLVSGDLTDCVISHIATAPDGGTWIGWYDAGSGYDIMVQKLDASGTPVFPAAAVAASQSLSWVQDFDMCAAGSGCAVAFSDGETADVAFIGADGTVEWSQTFGGNGGYHGSAQVCETNDGFIVAGWMDDSSTKLQRMDIDGTPMWDTPVELSGAAFFSMSDLKPASDHDVIASMVSYTTFNGPKKLKAQRVRADGSFVWGEAPIDVFTSGSLQYGNYPEFISDEAGGGIFTWYTTSNLQSSVQWVDADGVNRLGTNGTVLFASSLPHVTPSACFDSASGEVTIFCTKASGNQSEHGIQATRLHLDGSQLWGATGVEVAPLSASSSPFDLQVLDAGDQVIATWLQLDVAGAGTAQAVALSSGGMNNWSLFFSTDDVSRSDLKSTLNDGSVIAAWCDERDGQSRVYAQRIDPDGSLGGDGSCAGDFNGDDHVTVDDLLAMLAVWGSDDAQCDLNGNGEVDVEDLLALLAVWGPC